MIDSLSVSATPTTTTTAAIVTTTATTNRIIEEFKECGLHTISLSENGWEKTIEKYCNYHYLEKIHFFTHQEIANSEVIIDSSFLIEKHTSIPKIKGIYLITFKSSIYFHLFSFIFIYFHLFLI